MVGSRADIEQQVPKHPEIRLGLFAHGVVPRDDALCPRALSAARVRELSRLLGFRPREGSSQAKVPHRGQGGNVELPKGLVDAPEAGLALDLPFEEVEDELLARRPEKR